MNRIHKKGFNWNHPQIYHFESLYTIFSNFVDQNHALVGDIWDIFGDESKQNKKTESRSVIDLNCGKHITLQRLYNETDFSHDYLYLHTIYDYIPVKINNKTRFDSGSRSEISKVLRFCPQCMAQKYHSPIFQLLWINKCPIHGEDLVSQCHKCNKTMPFELTTKLFKKPFHCSCGHHLSNMNNTPKKTISEEPIRQYLEVINKAIENNFHVGINNQDFNARYLLNDGYFNLMEYYTSIYQARSINNNKFIKSIDPSMLAVFTNDKYLIEKKPPTYNYLTVKYLTQLSDKNYFYQFITKTNAEMYSNKITYYIRNKYFVGHEACIVKIKNLIKNNGIINYSFICPYAFAYILWEMYWRNDIIKMIGNNRYDYLKSHNEHFHLLYEYYIYFNSFYYSEEEKVKNAVSSKWLIKNILYVYLYHTILQTIKYTLDTESHIGQPIPQNFINHDQNPFYIIEKSDESIKFISALYFIKNTLKQSFTSSNKSIHHINVDNIINALKSTEIKKSAISLNKMSQWCKEAMRSLK